MILCPSVRVMIQARHCCKLLVLSRGAGWCKPLSPVVARCEVGRGLRLAFMMHKALYHLPAACHSRLQRCCGGYVSHPHEATYRLSQASNDVFVSGLSPPRWSHHPRPMVDLFHIDTYLSADVGAQGCNCRQGTSSVLQLLRFCICLQHNSAVGSDGPCHL